MKRARVTRTQQDFNGQPVLNLALENVTTLPVDGLFHGRIVWLETEETAYIYSGLQQRWRASAGDISAELLALNQRVDGKANLLHTHTTAQITDLATAVVDYLPPEPDIPSLVLLFENRLV